MRNDPLVEIPFYFRVVPVEFVCRSLPWFLSRNKHCLVEIGYEHGGVLTIYSYGGEAVVDWIFLIPHFPFVVGPATSVGQNMFAYVPSASNMSSMREDFVDRV